ncbi:MAG: glycosyltransferase [Thermoproteales archaeon]|nr:glycosyltransferase [Thermoproteales archaeon]
MRIMLATEWLPPDIGGVARHVDDLAKKLSERGHKVAVITRKKRRINKHYEVYEIDKLNYLRIFSSIRTNFPIRRILKNFEPDIVHSHHAFTPIPLFALRAAKNLNLPTILTNHSAYFYEYMISILRKMLNLWEKLKIRNYQLYTITLIYLYYLVYMVNPLE